MSSPSIRLRTAIRRPVRSALSVSGKHAHWSGSASPIVRRLLDWTDCAPYPVRQVLSNYPASPLKGKPNISLCPLSSLPAVQPSPAGLLACCPAAKWVGLCRQSPAEIVTPPGRGARFGLHLNLPNPSVSPAFRTALSLPFFPFPLLPFQNVASPSTALHCPATGPFSLLLIALYVHPACRGTLTVSPVSLLLLGIPYREAVSRMSWPHTSTTERR